ncbi:MAG TPA: TolC family protein [Blastocatellia bacterium]|nr:TolC family protein [Blastocatellia bacterium]
MKLQNILDGFAVAVIVALVAPGAASCSFTAFGQQQEQASQRDNEQQGNEQGWLGIVVRNRQAQSAGTPVTPQFSADLLDSANGLTADDLVRYALSHNGELIAARQMIAEARGRLRQAGLKANPLIESNYQHGITTTDNNTVVGAELPLELGGRRNARVNVAQREIDVRTAEAADFERRLAAEVRTKYAEAIAAIRNLKFTEDLLVLTRDSYSLVEARVARGKSAPLEQNVVLVEVNRTDALRIGFESKSTAAMFELKKATGMPAEESLKLKGDFEVDRQPPPLNDLIRDALTRRADLTAARAAEELAKAQIEQAQIEGKIDASIFANYMRQNMGFPVRGFDDSGALVPVQDVFHYATFGVRLTLPVRNKNQGNIEAAQALLEAARSRRGFGELLVRNEVTAAYARFQRARAALTVYREGVRNQAQSNLEVIKQTYNLGQKSLLDYISEQRRFIDIETGYTEALKEYFESLVEVGRASGTAANSGEER